MNINELKKYIRSNGIRLKATNIISSFKKKSVEQSNLTMKCLTCLVLFAFWFSNTFWLFAYMNAK